MKTVRLFFVTMVAAVLLPGTSLARHADHPSQQAPSQSVGKSDSNHQRDIELRDENGQTRSGVAGQFSQRSAPLTKTTIKHRSSTSHPQPAVSHPRRFNRTPVINGPPIHTPRAVIGPQEASRKTAIPVPTQVVSQRSLSAPSSAVSVNGRQFKNSRDSGARLAVSGGPLTSSRGTAVINGTNMKRKP